MSDFPLAGSREIARPRSSTRACSEAAFRAFVARLHFYAGLFVGPFILVAAITGTLYALTPQIESMLYRDQLQARSSGPARSLDDQAAAARAFVGDGPRLFAVRPAPGPGTTTRVMFMAPGLGDSETRAIFVDPATLAVQGDLVVYGTSGVLPLRTTLDAVHRNLLLGEFGRAYSELAASWLWIAALGGVLMWAWRPKKVRGAGEGARLRRRHGLIGVTIAAGLVFLSVTGLTWSRFAGDRVDALRAGLGWVTPSVSLALDGGATASAAGEHAHHGHDAAAAAAAPASAASLDAVLAAARAGGIDSAMAEIRPPRSEGAAWLVREYDRSWPTQVDTVAIDPRSMTIVSRADFASFPLVAKLIRWGVDAHMGVLFGVANQILLAGVGAALTTTIVYGYRLWWRRRPAPAAPAQTLSDGWLRLSRPVRIATAVAAVALGWALPMVGVSLVAFLLVDVVRWRLAKVVA